MGLFANSWPLSQDAQVDVVVRAPAGGAASWHVLDAGRLYEVQQNGATLTVVGLTFQTVGTEEELRAAPAHVVTRAYDILAGEVFPWHLPLSLSHAEIRDGAARCRCLFSFSLWHLDTDTERRLEPSSRGLDGETALTATFSRVSR